MLSDAQLDAIVHNLDQLRLKPAVRFRVIGALAPVLLGPEKLTAAEPVAVRPKKPARTRRKRTARPGSRRRSPRGRVARKRPNGDGKTEPEPRPLSSDVPTAATGWGRNQPHAVGGEAGRREFQPVTLADLGVTPVDQPRPTTSWPKGGQKNPERATTRDPDALALAYLRNELTKGPIAASAVDDMVERGRLSVAGVDKAKEELGVVAVRLNRGRGAVVHLRLPPQSVEAQA
jgi:hypothetical protein